MSDYDILKKIFDFCISYTFLIIFTPLYLFISLLIKITSRGPILFKQVRLGKGGKEFTLLKFRTMYPGAPDEIHENFVESVIYENNEKSGLYKIENDPRVTHVGKVLRKLSLDELPQFLNVVKGDMSLIGPRPPIPYEMKYFHRLQYKRLNVHPGITGYWQVSGRNKVDFKTMILMDLKYVQCRDFAFDTAIFIKTPFIMFFERASA